MHPDNRTQSLCFSIGTHLKKVMITFSDGTKKYLLLTEDQIRFYEWLSDNYLLEDDVSFDEMDDVTYTTI